MNVQTFSRDWAPIAQLVVTSLGLISLCLVYWQIRMTVRWNKINAHIQYFASFANGTRRDALDMELRRIGIDERKIDLDHSLGEDDVSRILADPAATRAVKRFLNDAEGLCIAVNSGATDEHYAFAENSHEIVTIYLRFQKYIQQRIELRGSDDLYINLKITASRWAQKIESTKKIREREIQRINKELEAQRGVLKRY